MQFDNDISVAGMIWNTETTKHVVFIKLLNCSQETLTHLWRYQAVPTLISVRPTIAVINRLFNRFCLNESFGFVQRKMRKRISKGRASADVLGKRLAFAVNDLQENACFFGSGLIFSPHLLQRASRSS